MNEALLGSKYFVLVGKIDHTVTPSGRDDLCRATEHAELWRVVSLSPCYESDSQMHAIPLGEFRRILRLDEKSTDARDPGLVLFAARSPRGLHRHPQGKAEHDRARYPYASSHGSSMAAVCDRHNVISQDGAKVAQVGKTDVASGYLAFPPFVAHLHLIEK